MVHEDEVVFITRVGPIRINSEHKLPGGIIGGEAIAGEKQRRLQNCELRFLLQHILVAIVVVVFVAVSMLQNRS